MVSVHERPSPGPGRLVRPDLFSEVLEQVPEEVVRSVPEDLLRLYPRVEDARLPEGIRLEALDRAHAPAVHDLVNRVFGLDRDLEHLLWKFWGSPAGPPAGAVAVEEESGRAVASYSAVARKLWIAGREILTMQACESAVDPAFRGGQLLRAVFSRTILEAAAAGAPVGYGGQTAPEVVVLGRRLLNYQQIFSLATWDLRLSLRPAMRRRLGAAGAFASGALDAVVRTVRRDQPTGSGLEVEHRETFDECCDQFWQHLRHAYLVAVVRDRAAMAWRYGACPVGRHRLLLARRGGEPAGFLVWREWAEGSEKVGRVLDLVDGRDREVAQVLLQEAATQAREADCTLLRFAPLPGSAAEAALLALRHWRPSPWEPLDRVIAGPLPRQPLTRRTLALQRLAMDGANWHYCQGDADLRD